MPVIFYPHDEDVQLGSIADRLEILMEAAERLKTSTSELSAVPKEKSDDVRLIIPREIKFAYNWQEVAKILREIREMPEGNAAMKAAKADRLMRLSEIYETLRSAKMPKLEAVRLALVNEASALRGGGSTPAAK